MIHGFLPLNGELGIARRPCKVNTSIIWEDHGHAPEQTASSSGMTSHIAEDSTSGPDARKLDR